MAIDLKATVMDTDGDMPYRNVNDIDDTPTTSFGRSVLNAANAAALRTLADSPSNAEAVLDALFDANTVLKADSDNTPTALTMGASTILARLAAGNIVAATPAELRTLLALVIGTNVQAWDADIDAIAALTSAADKVPYSTGAQAWALATLTSAGRALIDDADASAQRDTLGVFRGSDVPPTGALAETAPRDLFVAGSSGLNSGTLRMVSIWLPINTTVTSVTFVSSTQAAVAPTNWWFGLFDSSRVALRLTADQTSTAWAANTAKTVNLTSSFVTTYSGVHYLGIMMAAGTAINVQVYTANATLNALVPIRIGNTTDTGLTTPPGLPFTAGVITSSVNIIYAYVA